MNDLIATTSALGMCAAAAVAADVPSRLRANASAPAFAAAATHDSDVTGSPPRGAPV